jgi:uncharacterized protein
MNTTTASESIAVVETAEPAGESVPAVSPKTRKPRVWTAFATLIVAATAGFVATVATVIALCLGIGVVMGAQGAAGPAIQTRIQEIFQQPFTSMLLALIPFQLGMAVVVLYAAWRSKEPFKQRLGLLPQSGRTFGRLKLTTMAGFTLSVAMASLIFSSLFLGPPPKDGPVATVIANGSWWSIMLLSIVLSVIPALVEESLFRGYLQRRFLKRWSPAVAISISTLLFALMHMDSLQHIIAVVPLGLVTGLLAYRTNSIKPGMIVHAVHNMAVVGLASLATGLMPIIGQEKLGLIVLTLIGVLGLFGLSAVVSLLRTAKPRKSVETHAVMEPVVESPSVLSRRFALPSFAIDSRLASPAV